MNFHPIENSSDTAEIIVPILMDWYRPKSVLDLGCNTGQWLRQFKGIEIMGVDGENMISGLVISEGGFICADLTKQLDFERKYDLVLCLEVAEHLGEQYADILVDNACRHSDIVFWSAATPGQGGYHHVNEQPHEYWIEKFRLRGYEARLLSQELPVVPHDYYRKNAIEFIKIMSYSQNKEDLIVKDYFGDRTGTLLSVGENDGTTFSNARLLIEHGFSAYLFEPGTVCSDLIKLHRGNDKVHIFNKGLGDKVEKVKFYESAAHVKGGSDRGLVSTTDYRETIRWRKAGVRFVEREVQILDFAGWYEHSGSPKIEFVSIDCEGHDWTILQQMDLGAMGTEFIILEWNGDKGLEKKYTEYCGRFGLKECGRNSENLMFCL